VHFCSQDGGFEHHVLCTPPRRWRTGGPIPHLSRFGLPGFGCLTIRSDFDVATPKVFLPGLSLAKIFPTSWGRALKCASILEGLRKVRNHVFACVPAPLLLLRWGTDGQNVLTLVEGRRSTNR
jgi:hypothetical protein